MKTKLTDAQHEMFEHLTSRTFYVVDTEYTSGPAKDGNHLISIAVVPVVAGRRNPKDDFYKEMNPGVPIHPRAATKNGFTDNLVKGKRRFGFYAKPIIDALNDPDAVFVAHTNSDIKVLRDELTRLDQTRTPEAVQGWPALASLPELPIIDTSTLPRLVALEGVGHRGSISLGRLCELTAVRNAKPHHALYDARATADALLELLAQIAKKASFYALSNLLKAHDRGTTASPKGPAYITGRAASTTRSSHPRTSPDTRTRSTTQAPVKSCAPGWTWLRSASSFAASGSTTRFELPHQTTGQDSSARS